MLKGLDKGWVMPLYEVCLKGDDIYSLRVLASSRVEAISKAMGIVTNVSEKNLPNYRIQVIQIENDQPMCGGFDDALIEQ
jgi:hypothetical protein